MKYIAACVIGIVLGLLGSRVLFVGSAPSLLVWGIAALGLGWWAQSWKPAIVTGAAYGFCLAFFFMIFGYTGSMSLASRLPFFAILGVVGACCGSVLALVGALLRTYITKRTTQSSSQQ